MWYDSMAALCSCQWKYHSRALAFFSLSFFFPNGKLDLGKPLPLSSSSPHIRVSLVGWGWMLPSHTPRLFVNYKVWKL